MPGKKFYKIYCQSFTRASKFTKQCRAKGILKKNGKYRCRFHGGHNTGAKTLAGKVKSLSKLIQFKNYTEEELKQWILKKSLQN